MSETPLFETASDAEAVARAAAAAAPTVERADLGAVSTLEPALREPVRALLTSLADNKYVLGRRYAEWCTGAPLLESAVAAAAMAQDELGHARSFYPLLRGFGGDAAQMEERGWQERPTNALACLDRSFASWPDFIAANVVVDSAFTVLFEAASASPYEPLGQRARKIVQEEAAHWVHGTGWLRRLAPQMRPALEHVGTTRSPGSVHPTTRSCRLLQTRACSLVVPPICAPRYAIDLRRYYTRRTWQRCSIATSPGAAGTQPAAVYAAD